MTLDLAAARAGKSLDLVGMGAAIVDVLARVDDAFLATHDVAKGGMTLIDADRAERVHGAMDAPREVSGGSVANSIVGAAALGARTAFIGKIADDALGGFFRRDIEAAGVRFAAPPPVPAGAGATARSMVLVTDDAQRSMLTDLGVSGHLGAAEIDRAVIADAAVLFLEGYLWDHEETKSAFRAGMDAVKAAGGRAALTLSDTFCVERHRASFREIVAGPVDILLANEAEILSLYETTDFDAAVSQAASEAPLVVVTRSEKGCVAAAGAERAAAPAEPMGPLTDTTGAGDLFASGFLTGLLAGAPLGDAARMGCVSAAEVITHIGARPEADLAALFAERGLPTLRGG